MFTPMKNSNYLMYTMYVNKTPFHTHVKVCKWYEEPMKSPSPKGILDDTLMYLY